MKLRKILFGCGLGSAVLCTSVVLALDWYSSKWTIPNGEWHRPTRTLARPATGGTQRTKVTNISDQDCTIYSGIYKNGQPLTYTALEPGVECVHHSNVNKGDLIQAAFSSSNKWCDVEATIHWAP